MEHPASLSRNGYLQEDWVVRFVDFLARVIAGSESICYVFRARNPKIPAGHELVVQNDTLESAFGKYYWRQKSFDQNAKELEEIRKELEKAIDNSDYLEAIKRCMEWGLSPGAVRGNVDWANQQQELPRLIRDGVSIINHECPDVRPFHDEIRMNAGYTKVFALLCKKSIIYDGRVGGALGFLVRTFLERQHPDQLVVPEELKFPWDQGRARGCRNPSKAGLNFPALASGGPKTRSMNHATWNIKANWVIDTAIDTARKRLPNGREAWYSKNDALRRIEAALFMVGYDFPQSKDAVA